MSKYDWDYIPEYINYAATSAPGMKLGFIEKPKSQHEYCIMYADYLISGYVSSCPNWKDSLEERPK